MIWIQTYQYIQAEMPTHEQMNSYWRLKSNYNLSSKSSFPSLIDLGQVWKLALIFACWEHFIWNMTFPGNLVYVIVISHWRNESKFGGNCGLGVIAVIVVFITCFWIHPSNSFHLSFEKKLFNQHALAALLFVSFSDDNVDTEVDVEADVLSTGCFVFCANTQTFWSWDADAK